MKVVVIIPARYKSTRYPGKPLIDIAGKSMIRRVWEQCVKALPAELIYVATEDQRIVDHCHLNGIQCFLTSDNCLTGTDRIAEVSNMIDADYYINVQGDEPVFNPDDIISILEILPSVNGMILNGYCDILTEEEHKSVSTPKVVFRNDKRLLYMSRSPIPGNKQSQFHFGFRQVCIYAFPKKALETFASEKNKTPLENEEDIEILRFLELGYEVQMVQLSTLSIPVDHPEDVEKVLKHLNNVG